MYKYVKREAEFGKNSQKIRTCDFGPEEGETELAEILKLFCRCSSRHRRSSLVNFWLYIVHPSYTLHAGQILVRNVELRR